MSTPTGKEIEHKFFLAMEKLLLLHQDDALDARKIDCVFYGIKIAELFRIYYYIIAMQLTTRIYDLEKRLLFLEAMLNTGNRRTVYLELDVPNGITPEVINCAFITLASLFTNRDVPAHALILISQSGPDNEPSASIKDLVFEVNEYKKWLAERAKERQCGVVTYWHLLKEGVNEDEPDSTDAPLGGLDKTRGYGFITLCKTPVSPSTAPAEPVLFRGGQLVFYFTNADVDKKMGDELSGCEGKIPWGQIPVVFFDGGPPEKNWRKHAIGVTPPPPPTPKK